MLGHDGDSDGIRGRLLVLPGWDDDGKDQYDELAAMLRPRGWICRRADLPDATWPASRRDAATRGENLAQARADFDALEADAPEAASAILGFSYGGYIGALLSAERPADFLILRAPALYPDEDWEVPKAELDKRELDEYRRREHKPGADKALASCASFEGDALLVQGSADEVIPPEAYESYAKALRGASSFERIVLQGADHELSKARWRERYHAGAVEWLLRRADAFWGAS